MDRLLTDLDVQDVNDTPRSRRKQSGRATSDVVLSAHVGDNSDVFPELMSIHVAEGSCVADLTFGKGVFWRNIPKEKYQLFPTDIKYGQCWSKVDYDTASMDAVIFDPPYMEGLYRKNKSELAGSGTHSAFQDFYSDGSARDASKKRKYHDAVLEAYLSILPTIKKILKYGGKFIVKCQDEVSANRQKLTHVELIWAYEHAGFYCKDIFIVVRKNSPIVSRLVKQEHARKNHSYFLVFQRQDHRKKLDYSNFSLWLRED